MEKRPSLSRQPYTNLWALLYAQVTQADGASQRNVLLLTERWIMNQVLARLLPIFE
jgi:hypothetical protein